MSIGLYVTVGLLAALLVFSAVLKLSGRPDVVESYGRVGVARERLPVLAAVLLLGVAGLVAGLFWAPLGLAAAACLVLYFALAIAAHARHDDLNNVGAPVVLLLLAMVTAALFAATLP